MKIIKLLFCVFVFAILSGCAKDIPPGHYDASEIGKIKKVVSGVIISKRPVKFYSHTQGQNASDNLADNTVTPSHGFEYVIKLSSGDIISIAQSEDLKLKVKQHILVIQGDNTRIVPDDGSDDD